MKPDHEIIAPAGVEVTMNDYREVCRVHIKSLLPQGLAELKQQDLPAYYDTIFDLAADLSFSLGATVEEAVWSASHICSEF